MLNSEQQTNNLPMPALRQTDVISRFGQVKYSCEPTNDGWFHVIKADGWTAFISELEDEFLGTVYRRDKVINPAIEEQSVAEVFAEVEKRIQNGL